LLWCIGRFATIKCQNQQRATQPKYIVVFSHPLVSIAWTKRRRMYWGLFLSSIFLFRFFRNRRSQKDLYLRRLMRLHAQKSVLGAMWKNNIFLSKKGSLLQRLFFENSDFGPSEVRKKKPYSNWPYSLYSTYNNKLVIIYKY
jgi:hypothetical protein